MITVQNLQKKFGPIHAVRDLSFEVAKGETFGLLGPNGAGKSTTIAMLLGLVVPDGGSISVGGGDPATPATRRRIGVAPQTLSLYDELTARENLRFFGGLYGLRGAALNERIRWGLEFSGLTERAHHRVATYSGGMKRRLNIAVALVHEPEMLLLDEPTVGVDPHSRNHILESIENLNRSGLTILYTTHYMEEAQRLCHRVAIVDQGRLLAVDRVDRLLQQHGGQSQVTAEIVHWPAELEYPGLVEDRTLRFIAERPLEEVARLSGRGASFQTLQIASPNLESVFLSLTGRSLRD